MRGVLQSEGFQTKPLFNPKFFGFPSCQMKPASANEIVKTFIFKSIFAAFNFQGEPRWQFTRSHCIQILNFKGRIGVYFMIFSYKYLNSTRK